MCLRARLGNPLGYQAVHDEMLKVAENKKGVGELHKFTMGAAAGCIGVSLLAVLVGTPLMS